MIFNCLICFTENGGYQDNNAHAYETPYNTPYGQKQYNFAWDNFYKKRSSPRRFNVGNFLQNFERKLVQEKLRKGNGRNIKPSDAYRKRSNPRKFKLFGFLKQFERELAANEFKNQSKKSAANTISANRIGHIEGVNQSQIKNLKQKLDPELKKDMMAMGAETLARNRFGAEKAQYNGKNLKRIAAIIEGLRCFFRIKKRLFFIEELRLFFRY